ncbi:MAG: aspartate aminotransferase family protein [Dongiaceae bacterium]
MSHVFYRELGASMPVAVRGEGIHVIDRDGKRYIDACGGAAVSCLGHSHPTVIAAVQKQVQDLAFAYSAFFTSDAAEQLASALVEDAPGDLDQVFFVSGGSEAIEASLKLARQYFLEIGQKERRHFIARRQSYHGNTLGALAVGGNALRRAPYQPMLMDVHHIAPCYAYRGRAPDETEERYGLRVADELETAIIELGPDTVAAFVAEPVVGATLGAVPSVPGYFKRIREICDKYGVLLILDEVMCGMGRCGTRYACEYDGIAPDIVALAKGLGAGYQPIGAMVVSKRIWQEIREGSGFLAHGHTYVAHTTACAGALAVQQVIREENLLDNVVRQGVRLMDELTERLGNHAHVGDIRGRGLFVGVEFVKDRASKEPFDPKHQLHMRIKEAGIERGLICYPMPGTVDGRRGDHIVLAPPYNVTNDEIDQIVGRFGDAVDAAVAAVRG